MGKFMLLFIGLPLNPEDGNQLTGEYMQEWGAWIAGLAEKGVYDSGFPLEWTATAVTKDSATDHPLDEVDVGGYMMINAASLEDAIEIARQAPNVALGGTIIIRPCLDIGILIGNRHMAQNDTDQKIEQALHGGSDRYKDTFSRLGEVVEAVFPTAQAAFEWNLPGWKIERENVLEEARGTIDPRFVHVLIAERKAGLTVHLWNPVDYYWLDTQKEALQGAGFKVMRGCVQFNRKQPFPFDTMESVLRTIAL